MCQCLAASGKGRRPTLPVHSQVTNKLLLQLELLRQTYQVPWASIEELYKKVTEGNPLQDITLRAEIQRTVKAAQEVWQNTRHAGLAQFLQVDAGQVISSRNIGPHLLQHQILRQHLNEPTLLNGLNPTGTLTNGVVVDLVRFVKTERKPYTICQPVLTFLGANAKQVDKKSMDKIYEKYCSLQKSIKRPNGKEKLDSFVNAAAGEGPQTVWQPQAFPTPENIAHANAEKTCARLRRQLEEEEKKVRVGLGEKEVLQQMLNDKHGQVAELQRELDATKQQLATSDAVQNNLAATWQLKKQQLQQKAASFQEKYRAQEREVQRLKESLKTVKGSNYYKRLQRKEKELSKLDNDIKQHVFCKTKLGQLRRKAKELQTRLAELRRRSEKVHQRQQQGVDCLERENAALQSDNRPIVRLKLKDPETGCFTEEAKLCFSELSNEHEIAAARCGSVIQTVVKYLYNTTIPAEELPSEQTVVRCIDMGHALGKIQVAQALTDSAHHTS